MITVTLSPTNTPPPSPTNTPSPSPTNTPTPAPTNTPMPAPTNTSIPEPTIRTLPALSEESSPGGIHIEAQHAVYITDSNLMLREDASYDAKTVYVVPAGTELVSTGICENGWIRIEYYGGNVYVSEKYVTIK